MRRRLAVGVAAVMLAAGYALPADAQPRFGVDDLDPRTRASLDASMPLSCCGQSGFHTFADQPFSGVDEQGALLLPDEPAKDADGLRRDTLYFAGYQFAAVAILYAMPESVTNWTEEDKQDYSFSKYWNNVTNPQVDSDDFYLNYIIHPYWGASYFVRARERGYSNGESFWYSVLLSTMFEFGAEALAEEPSYQDLVFTPVLGSLVGLWFMDVREGVRERTADRGYRSTGDKWIWVLTDPLGSLNRQVDKLFGIETDVSFMPYFVATPAFHDPYARPYARRVLPDPAVGLKLTLSF